MAENQENLTKMISSQLRAKANDFLNSKKHANNLVDLLHMFEAQTNNYTPLLLTIEVIFTELLKRGELYEDVVPLKPAANTPETQYKKWLRECYEAALARILQCMKNGTIGSRIQALVTACKLLQAEGRYPLESVNGYSFPVGRLKNIFNVLLDSDQKMAASIQRFQEFAEYRDVQQYGLKVLHTFAFQKSPSKYYMLNYIELFHKLLSANLTMEAKDRDNGDGEEKREEALCAVEGRPFKFHPVACRRHANRGWAFLCRWPLAADAETHKRALVVLVERMMPLLSKPHMTTDLLCDSLDVGGPISMVALQGVLELMRQHNIDYPDVYARLYALFEPEMFATRYKKRLVHLADIFLSSTHLPEALVAAFAKRLSRLALLAAPPDAVPLLRLVANLLRRHPALKRMLQHDDAPALMSNDPYVMEETCPLSSRAVGSSLWEAAALRRCADAATADAAKQLFEGLDSRTPVDMKVPDEQMFDLALKRRFRGIELNFIRPHGLALPGDDERLLRYWDVTA